MRDETRGHLHDALMAAQFIKQHTDRRSVADYEADELFRSAIERKFEILGEALVRIRRDEPAVLERIDGYRSIISFRNILVHGYDVIDNHIVWEVITDDVDRLTHDIQALLSACDN
jgi:uncharacterized protein with HEPN domain